MFTSYAIGAVSHLIGQICELVKIWEANVMELPAYFAYSDYMADRKRKFPHQRRRTTFVSFVPSLHFIFVIIESK